MIKESDAFSLQQNVQEQLTQTGEYSPIQLLIALGRLLKVDFQEWQRGQLASLDQAIIGQRSLIETLLLTAEDYSSKTGLLRHPMTWQNWAARQGASDCNEGRLKVSDHTRLSDLLSCCYKPNRHQLQMDLFYDQRSLEDDVIDSFARGSLDDVDQSLQLLYQADPSHPVLGQFDHLKRYLKHCLNIPCAVDNLYREYRLLSEKIVPIAHTALKHQAKRFLNLCWLRLINASSSNGDQIKLGFPALSQLYAEVEDWSSVVAATTSELSSEVSCQLLLRRALAFSQQHLSLDSLHVWWMISVLYPELTGRYIDEQGDEYVRALWGDFDEWSQQFSQVEDRVNELYYGSAVDDFIAQSGGIEDCFNPYDAPSQLTVGCLVPAYFPSYCLLVRPALSSKAPRDLLSLIFCENLDAECLSAVNTYHSVIELIEIDGRTGLGISNDHAQRSIELRKKLSVDAPPLMRLYRQLRQEN